LVRLKAVCDLLNHFFACLPGVQAYHLCRQYLNRSPAVARPPMIAFKCPTCQQVMNTPDEAGGQKLACPKCGQRLQVPPPPQEGRHSVPVRQRLAGARAGGQQDQWLVLRAVPEALPGRMLPSDVLDDFRYPSSVPGLALGNAASSRPLPTPPKRLGLF
jgi:hypothetical protein